MMNKFDPYRYSITVRKENSDGEFLFVARVEEFPDMIVFSDTYEEAYSEMIGVIESAKEMYDEDGDLFPSPEPFIEETFSGRLPIRVTKSLHAQLHRAAKKEGVSLNYYVGTALMRYVATSSTMDFMEVIHKIQSDKSLRENFSGLSEVSGTTGYESLEENNVYHINGKRIMSNM